MIVLIDNAILYSLYYIIATSLIIATSVTKMLHCIICLWFELYSPQIWKRYVHGLSCQRVSNSHFNLYPTVFIFLKIQNLMFETHRKSGEHDLDEKTKCQWVDR